MAVPVMLSWCLLALLPHIGGQIDHQRLGGVIAFAQQVLIKSEIGFVDPPINVGVANETADDIGWQVSDLGVICCAADGISERRIGLSGLPDMDLMLTLLTGSEWRRRDHCRDVRGAGVVLGVSPGLKRGDRIDLDIQGGCLPRIDHCDLQVGAMTLATFAPLPGAHRHIGGRLIEGGSPRLAGKVGRSESAQQSAGAEKKGYPRRKGEAFLRVQQFVILLILSLFFPLGWLAGELLWTADQRRPFWRWARR